MIQITTFAGCRVAVFGLGGSGLASALALKAGGADVVGWDDGEAGRSAARAANVALEDLASADWSTLRALVLAPGVPLTHPEPHWTVKRARAAGVEIIGDVELFFRERAVSCPDAPVVCITGTNGKSTTTALVAHILEAAGRDVQMGGNIGKAILTLEPPARDRIHVIEMSSFQIDLTPSLAPTVGVLLNITPDHLDRHGPADELELAMRNYASIKERLVTSARMAVVGVTDGISLDGTCDQIAHRADGSGIPVLTFSRDRAQSNNTTYCEGGLLQRFVALDSGSGVLEVFTDIAGVATLRGSHNWENAAAAFNACDWLSIPHDAIGNAMRTFPGLPHRMEDVGRAGSVLFVNDSKATNADSTEKALASFTSDIYWIAGGKAKDGGIAMLAPYFPRIAKAYLIGEACEAFAETLAGKVAFERCGTLDVAVSAAARDAAASVAYEPVVLLSPACASYDQFKNFEVRGDRFRSLVSELIGTSRQGDVALAPSP
ncbi:MAG: UDP-N-acetylmuramoyl-L-alanine--D-glutamate ligase [Hyphomicrobiaceae bacterium]|nr:UDP-N-acetylmuramoyl-L-alanine--D-glutamate ligase [Hyphomicrobiaceae bacterium]